MGQPDKKIERNVKIVDVTLRDGGLVNNFYFSDQFVYNLYKANIESGADYMEFGYKSSKNLFSTSEFGPWKFCDEEMIRKIVGSNVSDMKICVMADVGRTDYEQDIIEKRDSVIDMVRVATYLKDINEAVKMIDFIKKKGYEVTCNIMAITTNSARDISKALSLLAKTEVDGVYIVDSYGALYPKDTQKLITQYRNILKKAGKFSGMHAHNNQQLALANSILALEQGVDYIDVSVSGLGRGAGNCAMELFYAYMHDPRYQLIPIYDFIENNIIPLREKGVLWGYDVPYLMTGMLNLHPRTAISFVKQGQRDYVDFYKMLYGNV